MDCAAFRSSKVLHWSGLLIDRMERHGRFHQTYSTVSAVQDHLRYIVHTIAPLDKTREKTHLEGLVFARTHVIYFEAYMTYVLVVLLLNTTVIRLEFV